MQPYRENDARRRATEIYEQAYRLQMNGKVAEAIKYYQLSLETYETSEAHTFLGWAYSFLGDYARAIEECTLAIELDPDYGNPYNDMAAYLIYLDKYDEAEFWLQRALRAERYASRHYAFYNLGRVYERQGRWFKALAQYHQAISIDPSYDMAALALLNLQAKMN
ncbi:MAG: tetratricopeptide repeat protein [Candidatus Kapaibacterium sp.]